MTIILNNNTYKYETEATVKLFIPAVRFEFLSDERNSDGDIIMTRIKHCRKNVYYYAYIRENGRVMRSSCTAPAESFDEKDGEFIICRLLFDTVLSDALQLLFIRLPLDGQCIQAYSGLS